MARSKYTARSSVIVAGFGGGNGVKK